MSKTYETLADELESFTYVYFGGTLRRAAAALRHGTAELDAANLRADKAEARIAFVRGWSKELQEAPPGARVVSRVGLSGEYYNAFQVLDAALNGNA